MMNVKSISVIALMSILAIPSFGQTKISEGVLNYDMKIESSKPLDASLANATFTVYFNSTQSRTEMKSGVGLEVNVYDEKAKSGFILKEYSGQKLMITATENNWNQKSEINTGAKFEIGNENYTIAGRSCKKAVGTLANGKSVVVYYDPSTTISNDTYNNAFPQIKGLIVQMEMKSGDVSMKYTLTSANSEKVSSIKFDAPKSGYRVMTYEQNQQLRKGEG